MNITDYKYIFFIGVGGIGMSALARYFINRGIYVAGYDKTATILTARLNKEGVDIHFEDNIELIPDVFKQIDKKHETLIIYTPAIPDNLNELNYFIDNKYNIFKRSEILGNIVNSSKGIAVAGTHGKTSVSTMITQILKNSELDCSAFLGGISKNFDGNFVSSENSEYVVAEADEFDRSFLKLHPYFGIITSIDADHLDIYKNKNSLINSFVSFAENIKEGGTLFIKKGITININNTKTYTYSLQDGGDYYADNLRIHNELYTFDVITPDKTIFDVRLGISGLFNVENSIIAIAVANQLGVNEIHIKKSLKEFTGIQRRFDYKINDKIIYIDDYAHHPEEIKACITATKHIYKDKKITGIFQPHLYSRTKDFADEFAKSLELLDELILLDIYPARELPIEGVNSDMILKKVNLSNKENCNLSELFDVLKSKEIEVLLTMGAGDIDTKVEEIKELLIKKYKIEIL